MVLVCLAIQDGVRCAGNGRPKSFPRDADEVAADGLEYQLSGRIEHYQQRRDVISSTGSSATPVATGIGRLDVIDEQRTSWA